MVTPESGSAYRKAIDTNANEDDDALLDEIVLAAAAVFVWSRTSLVPIQASTASSISINQPVASEVPASISPTDMMMNHKGSLPAEQWDPF
jgi:hypothetical protein